MSFFRYLKDNIRFIALYVALAAFMSAMALLGAHSGTQGKDAAYTVGVSFVLVAVCVCVDYAIRARQARQLAKLLDSEDKTPVLPEPADYKDEQYAALIGGLYARQMEQARRLEEDFRESKDFMAAWAHEAKTPVTAARLLLEAGIGEGGVESLLEEIERINNSIERILFYSRSDSFSKDYIISEEMLEPLVKENVKKHSVLFIKKKIRVSIDIPAGISVYTDRKWLLFIMDQLLSNALKYSFANGVIAITARQDSRETVLSYADSGRGIAQEDLSRIFDKSFTGANGRSPGSAATGLGLYLAQKLARKLDHNIVISSQQGGGTVAQIHFPVIDDLFNLTKV